jgi:hypothetical protein
VDSPSTNKGVIFVIVITLAGNATILVCTLAYCVIFKIDPNTVLLTAIIALVNYILGAISGMLVKTSPTSATASPSAPSGSPAQVLVANTPDDPVPTTETKP